MKLQTIMTVANASEVRTIHIRCRYPCTPETSRDFNFDAQLFSYHGESITQRSPCCTNNGNSSSIQMHHSPRF